ncbi:glycoside hydrolase family 32 protein [Aquibacillus rhizosphaerae]|uniref:Sucrose-6-phosphate hydrolase n=1 Tax=Aquibacillus rhizosphaerae TaxID=3051431 RepID=A0ABT7LBB0_9BACI|nr:glycoside hydrolase family 32 protein [Aquibacillus sp. LR5S19]MDL4843147.1 glycoside hydrolase family 32 protein [Aquibacillus sp. LR5S19]
MNEIDGIHTKYDKEIRIGAYDAIKQYKDIVNQDPYRLHYHLMPPVGLLNDPNGFVYYKGLYHLFYQWNPFATEHGAKFWGHFSSRDLVRWKEEQIALAPSSSFDKNGCYSGSAVVHDDQLYLFYTGNVRDEAGNRETYQCLAISEDGVDFVKKGPVIELPSGYTAHFRDPKVWKQDDKWYMVIGAQTEKETGTVVLYRSTDLCNWQYLSLISDEQEFGYMWECPDLFSLQNKDILLFSPQGIEPDGYRYNNIYQSGYFVGKLDYQEAYYEHGAFKELDRGFDFYAPQTTLDEKGRRLVFGWMGVPEENEQDHPTIESYWIHAMTIPRQLLLRGDKLYQQPVDELVNLRTELIEYRHVTMEDNQLELQKISGKSLELVVEVKEHTNKYFSVFLGKTTRITFDQENKVFTLERKSINGEELETRHCHLNKLSRLRIFLDTSSIEIFINDGEEVFTSRIFDDQENDTISFQSKGKTIVDVYKWKLSNVMNK